MKAREIRAGIERGSRTWIVLKIWAEQRIETLQVELEQPGLGVRETAAVRGRLAELRAFIQLGREPVDDFAEPATYEP